MANFHICFSGHDCGHNNNKPNLREVGEKIIFSAGQFTQSVAESLTVRVMPQGA